MIEPVERKIQELNLQKKDALKKQKKANLIRWGFDGKKKNKRDIPVVLTDEEYEAVLEADKSLSSTAKSDKNLMANILFFMGIAAIVIGIVTGIVLIQLVKDVAFIYLTLSVVIGVLVGFIFFGLSEVIKLLQQLIDRD